MTITALGVAWVFSSLVLAPPLGRIPATADRVGRLADVIPLFPLAPEPDPLPARLSPRAGNGTRRFLRRLRRSRAVTDLRSHGWLVGLLAAGLLCIGFTGGVR